MLNLLWQASFLAANVWAASGGSTEIFQINPFERAVAPEPAAPNGAVLGAELGALLADPRNAVTDAAPNAGASRKMSIKDVLQMSQNKVPDMVIVNQMNTSGSWFDLRTDDILYLRQQGVSDYIISQMQVRRGATAVIVQSRPRYVYDPYAPPPVGATVVISR